MHLTFSTSGEGRNWLVAFIVVAFIVVALIVVLVGSIAMKFAPTTPGKRNL